MIARLILLFSLLLAAAAVPARGEVLNVPGAQDMAYDAAHGTVLITRDDRLLRYSTASHTFLAPIVFPAGASLRGIDIDEATGTAAIADVATATNGAELLAWVYLLDTSTLQFRKVTFARAMSYETGSYSVAWASDHGLLVTSSCACSGWVGLRRLTPAGAWQLRGSVRQDSMLSASADRDTIAFEESDISDGAWGLYDVPTDQLVQRSGYTDGTSHFNFEIATDGMGSRVFIPTRDGVYVYDTAYAHTGTIVDPDGSAAVGVAHHPVRNELYLPWSGTSKVRIYDSSTLARLGEFDAGSRFDWQTGYGSRGFGPGRTRLSPDGTLLMVGTTAGVALIRQDLPLAAESFSVPARRLSPTAVTLRGSIGGGGTIAYTLTQPRNGRVTLSGDVATYVPSLGASTRHVDSFTYTVHYGRATATGTVTLTFP